MPVETDFSPLANGMFYRHPSIQLIIDPFSERIISANKAASKFYGFSLEQMADMPLKNILAISSRQAEQEIINAKSEKRNFFRFKHKTANGSQKDVEIRTSSIDYAGQTALYFIINCVFNFFRFI